MHDQPIPTIIPAEPDTTPDLTPAIALLRKLFAAGWKADHSYEIADDATVYGLIHPSGREASAVVYPDGQHTVTLSGLDLGQVVGAVTGAGLAPDSVQPACLNLLTPGHGCTGTPEPGGLHCADCIKADWWLSLAADLRTIAERAAALAGTDTPPVFGPYLGIYTSYVESDADRAVPVVDALAAAFGTTALTQTEGRGNNRSTERKMKATLGKVRVAAAARMPNPPTRQEKLRSRVELEAENAKLRAALEATQGGAR